MIKLIVFIFPLLTAQNLYNGQINFSYSGTESGSFNSLLADSTKTGLLINQDDSSIIIASFTQYDDNNYDLFFSILQDTIFPVQERTFDIPGSGDQNNPISLEALTLFIPNIDSNFVIQLLEIINDSTSNDDSVDIENYLEDIFLEFSNDLYVGFDKSVASDIKIANVSGSVNKPRFHFEGLHSRNDAEAMIGKLLFASVNKEDPINLISPDLIGASVISNNGKNIGTLVDMMSLPAHDVYVISNSNNKEVLIPVVPEFIESVDYDSQNVIISPIEGLF